MVVRGTPKNIEEYIAVDDNTALLLHSNNFFPKYIDVSYTYFKKSKEILKFMERRKKNG